MNISDIINKPFTFNRRRQLIPSELRPLWKASLVILIFGILSKNNKCSLKKVHIANWLSKSSVHVGDYLDWSKDTTQIRPDIRMEPALDRVLEMLVSDGILIKTKGKLEITEFGQSIFIKLNEFELLGVERNYLLAVKKYMTETNIDRVFKVV